MTDLALPFRPRPDIERRALLPAAVAILAFTVFAFAQKVVVVPERIERYTPLVVAHALSMIAWLSLFVLQTWLARHDGVRAHKASGTLSVVVVAAVLVTGFEVSRRFTAESGMVAVFLTNMVQLASLGLLWGAGVVMAVRHRIDAHRRLMLLATLATLSPPISRVTQTLGLPNAVAAMLHLGLVFALPLAYDLAARGRVHGATLAGLGLISALIALALAFGLAPPLAARVDAFLGLPGGGG